MALPENPFPVKYLLPILYKDSLWFDKAVMALSDRWGSFDFVGEKHLFNVTDYYVQEMGSPLYRRIMSFATLYPPTHLVEMKLRCNDIETELSIKGKRTVNLDAGYLDHNKYLLASAKEAGQKIYLDKGIYADLSGRYKEGKYRPFEWSFPDFRDGRYDDDLLAIRKQYLVQLRVYRSVLLQGKT